MFNQKRKAAAAAIAREVAPRAIAPFVSDITAPASFKRLVYTVDTVVLPGPRFSKMKTKEYLSSLYML